MVHAHLSATSVLLPNKRWWKSNVLFLFFSTEEKVIENFQSGHILRSKAITTNEGGVAAGYAALDSPYLI